MWWNPEQKADDEFEDEEGDEEEEKEQPEEPEPESGPSLLSAISTDESELVMDSYEIVWCVTH